MATLTVTPTQTFISGDTVVPATLNQLAQSTVALTAGTIVAGDIAADAVIPSKLAQPLTFETAQATTSGVAINFTDIPSWAKRITVMLNQVSTNGTSGLIIQLGDSGGFKTSGYIGTGTAITGANACGISNFTVGFNAGTGTLATSARSGCVFLLNVQENAWLASGTVTNGLIAAGHVQGVVVVGGVLDRLRLTTIGGTDAFDAGSVNIAYE